MISSKLIMYIAGILIGLASIGGILYTFHYSPMKKLKTTVGDRDLAILELKFELQDTKTNLSNAKVLLIKCQDDIQISIFEAKQACLAYEVERTYLDYVNKYTNIGDIGENNITIDDANTTYFNF